MRTNIDLDDKLLEAAFRCASVKSKKELVHLALKEFVEHHQRKDLRELRGRVGIRSDYDYKALREVSRTNSPSTASGPARTCADCV